MRRIARKISFKERLRRWLLDENYYSDQPVMAENTVGCEPSINSSGFRLQVYKASGGVVVEATQYDRRKDENRNSLYVVTEDKDLGEEIGKIITMENLK